VVARPLHPVGVLIVGSYRSDEARAQPGVWDKLQALDRDGVRVRLALARLDTAATGELIRSALGWGKPAPLFENRLYTETGRRRSCGRRRWCGGLRCSNPTSAAGTSTGWRRIGEGCRASGGRSADGGSAPASDRQLGPASMVDGGVAAAASAGARESNHTAAGETDCPGERLVRGCLSGGVPNLIRSRGAGSLYTDCIV
jgi:hypothetical protein